MPETEHTTQAPTNGVEHDDLFPADGLPLVNAPPRRWGLRQGVIAAGVLAVLVLAALGLWQLLNPPSTVQTAAVRRDTIISSVETNGKLEAQTVAKVGFRNGGRITVIHVQEGETVTAGQVLAELDTADLSRRLDEANVQLQISRLRLQQAEDGPRPEELASAAADLEAATARLNTAQSGGRAQDIAAAQAALDSANARLAAAQSGATKDQIAAAQAALDEAQASYNKVKAGPTAQDLAAAEAGVRAAQANYDKLKAGATADDLTAAQARVDAA
jgi:multidrug efflux pump subunit AcrA (membrane-fusion protein)